MTDLLDHIAIGLRALPHLPEIVFPLIGALALLNGMLAARVWRRLALRHPALRRFSLRRALRRH